MEPNNDKPNSESTNPETLDQVTPNSQIEPESSVNNPQSVSSHESRRSASVRSRTRTNVAASTKKKWFKRPVFIVPMVVLVVLVGVFIYISTKLNVLNTDVKVNPSIMPTDTAESAPTSLPELGTTDVTKIVDQTPKQVYENPKALNILLLGLDTRNPKQFDGGRTDSIIVVTLDTVNKKIKLTSIMRDTLLAVPGHDLNRINTVYGFCGPTVAMQTVQKYFGVKIDYYAVVNFWAVANIIDALGGVDVEVKSAELANLNRQLDEINKYNTDTDSPHVKKAGQQKLNGKQAVAYMRIRHVGDADFERTERQRKVLQAIANKDLSLSDILGMVNMLPDNVRTNATQAQMISLANTVFGLKGKPITQLRLPMNGTYKMSRYKGMSILNVDFIKNAAALKTFLQSK
jgi:polyisoprenyl-teichoic acid--peptidoglycan teichoic acid transferase